MEDREIEQMDAPATEKKNENNPSEIERNSSQKNETTKSGEEDEETSEEPMLELRKYILLLATQVATVTYAAGFHPPGGVWQDTDDVAGYLAGDPILRDTHYRRYLVFFYCNAIAFTTSLVLVVLVLFVTLLHKQKEANVYPLWVVMVVDLLSVMGAYAAGTCRDTATTIYSLLLVSGAFVYLAVQMALAWTHGHPYNDDIVKKRLRKILMLLATFAVSVTYAAGMSTPGGFWDNDAEGGHRLGDAILKDRHPARLTVFICFNTTAFVASLLIIVVLLDRKYREKEAYGWITVALISLIGSYTTGSCRQIDTTVYVSSLVGAVLIFIALLVVVFWKGDPSVLPSNPSVLPWNKWLTNDERNEATNAPYLFLLLKQVQVYINGYASVLLWNKWTKLKVASKWLREAIEKSQGWQTTDVSNEANNARSLVILLATLAAAITYQAGLDPPGGVWPNNGDRHMAGDPILLTTNPRRYNAFFYCNSIAFMASLVAIILAQNELLLKTHVLEAAMILDLFGLIGAYGAGSCRDVSTSINAMALAGVILVYVLIHIVFFTLDHGETGTINYDDLVEKRRKRLLLFAVLAATITYQAGLTPPGGFLLQDDESGHLAGDPVLLFNYPRRHKAFFYCNSVSFMLSIALVILLVNPIVYRPAIRSNALSVCTAVGLFSLIGAYAAGSTQHLKTSISIFVLVAVVLVAVVILLLVRLQTGKEPPPKELVEKKEDSKMHARRKYLMLLGILVASVTYQAGLDPPGGVWQHSSDTHDAGNPMMHDNRRHRYLAFFYGNSISFAASILVILLLLPKPLHQKKWWLRAMNTTIVLDLVCLIEAYAAGSSRGWKTFGYAIALVFAVLDYIAIHLALLFVIRKRQARREHPHPQENVCVHCQQQV